MNTPESRKLTATAQPLECEATLDAMRRTIERLGYLRIDEATCEGEMNQMIRMRLMPKGKQVDLESMKLDLRMLWELEIARTSDAIFQVADTHSGFEFRFALLHELKQFVSGTITVDVLDI